MEYPVLLNILPDNALAPCITRSSKDILNSKDLGWTFALDQYPIDIYPRDFAICGGIEYIWQAGLRSLHASSNP